MKFVVTATQSVNSVSENMAEFIEASRLEYVPRNRRSLAKLAADHNAAGIIVWETAGPILYFAGEKLFFHPSMAKCRIAAYRNRKQEDVMIRACKLIKGDSFLDCTLGMGADSIVAAYFSETGQITGLESESIIARVIGWGMTMYEGQMPWLDNAIRRIEVINCDYQSYLRQLPEGSYDIVYFDPMFTRPILHSQPISALRKLANHDLLEKPVVQEACRVARKRVVIKTRAADNEIERLGFKREPGSKHNPIAYGFIE